MFHCHACGNRSCGAGTVDEVFHIGDRRVLVEKIPANICDRCGEPTFSRETTESIRKLVQGGGRPLRTDPLEVFAIS